MYVPAVRKHTSSMSQGAGMCVCVCVCVCVCTIQHNIIDKLLMGAKGTRYIPGAQGLRHLEARHTAQCLHTQQ